MTAPTARVIESRYGKGPAFRVRFTDAGKFALYVEDRTPSDLADPDAAWRRLGELSVYTGRLSPASRSDASLYAEAMFAFAHSAWAKTLVSRELRRLARIGERVEREREAAKAQRAKQRRAGK